MNEHPASTIFPLLDGIELSALADDIRAHGLLDPIVLCDGQVLDGRNRLRACELAGVGPTFVEWEPDGMTPTEWVVSHNLHRRHLTSGQRAALALDLLPRLEEEARERQLSGLKQGAEIPVSPETDERGRSDEKAADLVGLGRSTVAAAKAIQRRDPTGDVISELRAGAITVNEGRRKVGLETGRGFVDGQKDSIGRITPAIYYGRGDRWREATEPLRRYLRGWDARGFEFGHVNPSEAQKRIRRIDELIEGLTRARNDLEPRSHKARPFSLGGRS